MYSESLCFDGDGKLFVRSVSLLVNCARSCRMSALFLLLGMGMKESPFSSSAVSWVDKGCEDLLLINLL